MEIGFTVEAAKPKGREQDDAPTRAPMAPRGPDRRSPSTDQIKARRQMAKSASAAMDQIVSMISALSTIDLQKLWSLASEQQAKTTDRSEQNALATVRGKIMAEFQSRGLEPAMAAKTAADDFGGGGMLAALWVKIKEWLIGHNGYSDYADEYAFASLRSTAVDKASFDADFDKLSEALAPFVIDLGDGAQGLSPSAPPDLAQAYNELLQIGYANGFLASLKESSSMDKTLDQQIGEKLAAMASAPLPEQRKLAEEVAALRQQRTAAVQADREIDLGAQDYVTTMPFVSHSTATDWLGEDGGADLMEAQRSMAAHASKWYLSTHASVRADEGEFQVQARGMANSLAGAHAPHMQEASDAFVRHALFLNRGSAEALQSTASAEQTPAPAFVTPAHGAPWITMQRTAGDNVADPTKPWSEQAGTVSDGDKVVGEVIIEDPAQDVPFDTFGAPVAPENAAALAQEGEHVPMTGAGEGASKTASDPNAGLWWYVEPNGNKTGPFTAEDRDSLPDDPPLPSLQPGGQYVPLGATAAIRGYIFSQDKTSKMAAWNDGTEYVPWEEIKVGDRLRFPDFGDGGPTYGGDWTLLEIRPNSNPDIYGDDVVWVLGGRSDRKDITMMPPTQRWKGQPDRQQKVHRITASKMAYKVDGYDVKAPGKDWVHLDTDDYEEVEAAVKKMSTPGQPSSVIHVKNLFNNSITVFIVSGWGGGSIESVQSYEQFYGHPYTGSRKTATTVNLGNPSGDVAPGDQVLAGGQPSLVKTVIIHPPGKHPEGAPIVDDMYAVEVQTMNGQTRWCGGTKAEIGSDLRVHWSRPDTRQAAREDYEHWNEDADRIWWEEEGRHGGDSGTRIKSQTKTAAAATCSKCAAPATKYVMGPYAGDWGDAYCDAHAESINQGYGGKGIIQPLASGGSTCSVCGDSITRDPEGEENRTWHHTNGTSHDHEAKPSEGTEASLKTAAPVVYCTGMTGGCGGTSTDITYIDREGYVYCDACGPRRAAHMPCRKLKPAEIEKIKSGRPLNSYSGSLRAEAGVYCNTHQVWVGDGNASTHEGCSKEQKATDKTKEAAYGPGTGANGWPYAPNPTPLAGAPDTNWTLSCPDCGSTSVRMSAVYGPGGRLGDPGAMNSIECLDCGKKDFYPLAKDRTAAVRTHISWQQGIAPSGAEYFKAKVDGYDIDVRPLQEGEGEPGWWVWSVTGNGDNGPRNKHGQAADRDEAEEIALGVVDNGQNAFTMESAKTADLGTFTCADCGKTEDGINKFPGDLCPDCYAKSQEGAPMPTAQDIVEMWGGTWKGGSTHTADATPGKVEGEVKVGDPNNPAKMWPWELPEGDVKTGEDAADVASVPTPGGESGYPKVTSAVADPSKLAAFRQRVAARQA